LSFRGRGKPDGTALLRRPAAGAARGARLEPAGVGRAGGPARDDRQPVRAGHAQADLGNRAGPGRGAGGRLPGLLPAAGGAAGEARPRPAAEAAARTRGGSAARRGEAGAAEDGPGQGEAEGVVMAEPREGSHTLRVQLPADLWDALSAEAVTRGESVT